MEVKSEKRNLVIEMEMPDGEVGGYRLVPVGVGEDHGDDGPEVIRTASCGWNCKNAVVLKTT